MILLLDGYNILKQVLTTNSISQMERDAFVRLLGKYGEKKNHKVIIFFDGGPYEKPYDSRLKGVTVWYAGYYMTADDLIIQHAPLYKNKDAALVTGDRELINQTKPYFKTVFEPIFFYNQVKETLQPPISHLPDTTLIKLSEESNPELDALMEQAASLPIFFKNEKESLETNKQVTLSKKERAMEKNKKKL